MRSWPFCVNHFFDEKCLRAIICLAYDQCGDKFSKTRYFYWIL